jgi:cytoskeletal protein RodZ
MSVYKQPLMGKIKMSRRSKKPHLIKSRKFLLLAAALLILLGVGATFALKNNSNSSSSNPATGANSSSNASGSSTYSTTPLNPSVNAPNDVRKESSNSQPTLTSPPPSSSQKIMVTLTGVYSDGAAVNVGTLVNGTSSGTCQVIASHTGRSSITAKSSVTLSPDHKHYVCSGFGLKKSQFTSENWHFVVTVSSGGQTASDVFDGDPTES